MGPVVLGFLASLVAGLVTGVGAIPVLFGRTISRRLHDALLGFAAGIMLSASFFSLIMPGLDAALVLYEATMAVAAIGVAGVVLGAVSIAAINEFVPHEHFVQGASRARCGIPRSDLALRPCDHDIQSAGGLGCGRGFRRRRRPGRASARNRHWSAERAGRAGRRHGAAVMRLLTSHAFVVATLTGLVEQVTGFLGAYAVSLSESLLPWGMTFAAGAMIYVISHEIIPETHQHGYPCEATAGLTAGLAIMMFLDVAFGST